MFQPRPDDEKLVSKGTDGPDTRKSPWIVDSTVYDFRLYAASQPRQADRLGKGQDVTSIPRRRFYVSLQTKRCAETST